MSDYVLISRDRLRKEAKRIIEAEPDLGLEAAYDRAHARLSMQVCEADAVSPFEETLINAIKELSPTGAPVRTVRLSTALNGADTWKLWYHLRNLRERGLVTNHGKSGWVIAA